MSEVVEFGLLDRLRLEEIMHFELNTIDGLRLVESRWDVLDNDTAREIRELVFEGDGLLAIAAADIYQDGPLLFSGEGADFIFNGEAVNPMITTLHRHEVSKALHVFWMLIHPFERREVGVERFLEGGIFVGGDVLVLLFLEKIWKGLSDRSGYVKPEIRSAALKRPLIDLGLHLGYRSGCIWICEEFSEAIGCELILSSLLDHAESCLRSQNAFYR
jgi:hypothetical protein